MAGGKVSNPQPDVPRVSKSPLEALQPNPVYEDGVLAKYGPTTVGALIGLGTVLCANYISKIPFTAGIYRYPIAGLAGALAVYQMAKYKEGQWAERDAVFRHYVSLHPEDFPPYKRVKLGQVFDDWAPIR